MASIAWSTFLPDILVEVPGVSEPLAERHAREAAIKFCRRSKAYVYTLDPIPVIANQPEYDFGAPSKTVIVEPLELWLAGEKLIPATSAELSATYKDWKSQSGVPKYYLAETHDVNLRLLTLALTPNTSDATGVTGRVALAPTRDATGIEEIIYEDYGREIAYGALATLLLMANKPWSKPDLGDDYRKRFGAACGSAAFRAARGNSGAGLRVATTHRVS